MAIELVLRDPAGTAVANMEQVKGYLRGLPGVKEEGNDFTFMQDEEGIFVVVRPVAAASTGGEPPECSEARIRVPTHLVRSSAEAMAGMAFSLARRFGWTVLDAATGHPYSSEEGLAHHFGAPPASGRSGCAAFALAAAAALVALAHGWR